MINLFYPGLFIITLTALSILHVDTHILPQQSKDISDPELETQINFHSVKKRHTTGTETSSLDDDDEEDSGCICVPHNECVNQTIITNLEGLLDERTRKCENPNDVLCGCNKNKDHSEEQQIHHYENDKTSSSYQTSGDNKNSHYGSTYSGGSNLNQTSSYTQQEYTNKGGNIGISSQSSDDNFNCFCQKGSASSNNHQQHHGSGHHHTHHDSHKHHNSNGLNAYQDKNKDKTEITCGPAKEMHCVCKRRPQQNSMNQKTSYGHHHVPAHILDKNEEEELQCICQHGQMQSTNQWSYEQTNKDDNIGSSEQFTGAQEHLHGTQSTSSGSHSYSHSQSSGSNYNQQENTHTGNESDKDALYLSTGTSNYGEKEHNTGSTNAYSHSQSQSQSGYISGSKETSYQTTKDVNYGKYSTEDYSSVLKHTTEVVGHGEHKYTSGSTGTTGTSNSHSHSQSETHHAGGISYGLNSDSQHKDDKTTTNHHTTNNLDNNKHGYTGMTGTGTNGNSGTTYSYSNSQSESHSSGETNYGQTSHGSHDKHDGTNSGLYTTDKTDYNQHQQTVGIEGSTSSTHSHSHSESQSHTSEGVDKEDHKHSHGHESSTSSSHYANDKNIYGEHDHTSATKDTTSTGTTNSYSYSHAESESHSTSYGQDSHSLNEENATSSSHKHANENNAGHYGHTTGTESSNTGTYSSHTHSESQSHSSGHEGHEHSHGQESGTSISNQHTSTSENEHGQHEHTSGSEGNTGTSNSYAQSHSQTHSSGHTSYGQNNQEGSTGTSQHQTNEKDHSQHEHASGTGDNSGTTHAHSHSESQSHSSGGTKYGQDGHSHSHEGSTGTSQHTDEENQSQYGHTSGHKNSSTYHTSSSGETSYGQTHGSSGYNNSASHSHFHNGSQSSSGGSSEGTSHGHHENNNNKDHNSSDIYEDFGCGLRKDGDVSKRIKNDGPDSESLFGQFPWMVAILTKTKNPEEGKEDYFSFVCGGSLLHKKIVLTATHCIVRKDAKTLTVRAGEWNAQANDEILPYQQQEVEKIIKHPDYYSGALYNDIALMVVKEPFEFADNVDIVCLPPPNFNIDYSEKCVVSGWGKDSLEKNSKYQPILRQVELPLIPHHKCEDKFRKTRLGEKFNLHRSFICAGGEINKDSCKGDGGGPLVCPIKGSPDRYQQLGIVSWGIGCGTDTPAAYSNVKSFTNWIDTEMHKLNLKPQYYYK